MGCCYNLYSSSFVRQLLLTLFPMAAMIGLIIHLNSLDTRESRETTSYSTIIGIESMSRNLELFFDEVELTTNYVREAIASGTWKDPSSISEFLDFVLPVMTTQDMFRGLLYATSNQQSASLTRVEPSLLASTVDAGEVLGDALSGKRVFQFQMDALGADSELNSIRRYVTDGSRSYVEWTSPSYTEYPSSWPTRPGSTRFTTATEQPWWPNSHGTSNTWFAPHDDDTLGDFWKYTSFVSQGLANNNRWSEEGTNPANSSEKLAPSVITRGIVRASAVAQVHDLAPAGGSFMVRDKSNIIILCSKFPNLVGKNVDELGDDPLNSGNSVGKKTINGSSWHASFIQDDIPGYDANDLYISSVDMSHSAAVGGVVQFLQRIAFATMAPIRLVQQGILDDYKDLPELTRTLLPYYISVKEELEVLVVCEGTGKLCLYIHEALLASGEVIRNEMDMEVRLIGDALRKITRFYPADEPGARWKWERKTQTIVEVPEEFLHPYAGNDQKFDESYAGVGLDVRYRPPVMGPYSHESALNVNTHFTSVLGFPVCWRWPLPQGSLFFGKIGCMNLVMSVSHLRQALLDMRLDKHEYGGAIVADGDGNVIVSTHHIPRNRSHKLWNLNELPELFPENYTKTNMSKITATIHNKARFDALLVAGKVVNMNGDEVILAQKVYHPVRASVSPEGGYLSETTIGTPLYLIVHVNREVVEKENINFTVYVLDGLVVLVLLLYILHALHFFHHMSSLAHISNIMDSVAEMDFAKVDYEAVSKGYHWNNDLQSMQRSALKLFFAMQDYKSMMGTAVDKKWNPSAGKIVDETGTAAGSNVKSTKLFTDFKTERQLGLHKKRIIALSVIVPTVPEFPSICEKLTEAMGHEYGGFLLRPKVIHMQDSNREVKQFMRMVCSWDSDPAHAGKRAVLAWKCMRRCHELLTSKDGNLAGPKAPVSITGPANNGVVGTEDVEMTIRETEARSAWNGGHLTGACLALTEGEGVVGLIGDKNMKEMMITGAVMNTTENMQRYVSERLPFNALQPTTRMVMDLGIRDLIQKEVSSKDPIAFPIGAIERRSKLETTICESPENGNTAKRSSLDAASRVVMLLVGGDLEQAARVAACTPSNVKESDGSLWTNIDTSLTTETTSVVLTLW